MGNNRKDNKVKKEGYIDHRDRERQRQKERERVREIARDKVKEKRLCRFVDFIIELTISTRHHALLT